MTDLDFSALPAELRADRFRKTLADLSKTKPKSGEEVRYCLDPDSAVGQIKALDFDAIKSAWYAEGFVFLGKSADALIVDGGDYFLVEFKVSKMPVAETMRKVYDSAVALVEHGILTWESCRQRLSFILVGKQARLRFDRNYGRLAAEFMAENYRNADADPRILTGQVVREVYVMDVPDFTSFTLEKGWQ